MKISQYVASDGKTFDTNAECREHNRGIDFAGLAGKTIDEIKDALSCKNKELARLLGKAGFICTQARMKNDGTGRFAKTKKRQPKPVAGV